ncbi:hypothetical protein [Rhizobium sp. Nf11,1]
MFHANIARQVWCSRWLTSLRKNGGVSTVTVSPHLRQEMTEKAS